MILRVRSPLGMARFDVSEEDSVTALRGKVSHGCPTRHVEFGGPSFLDFG